jgi:hypothetical protein
MSTAVAVALPPARRERPAGLPSKRENTSRLVTLWDIVDQFSLHGFVLLWQRLQAIQLECQRLGDARMDDRAWQALQVSLGMLRDRFRQMGFGGPVIQIEHLLARQETVLSRRTGTALTVETQAIVDRVLEEMNRHGFVRVRPDRMGLLHGDEPFGPAVAAAFPSAAEDIREALNCLTVESHTAAGFHLMRAAEYGLRALAYDRRVRIPKQKEIELATWEQIIRELENAESAIQKSPRTDAREAQFAFYHGAMMEFRAFKNVWRNRFAHAREPLDRDQAYSVMVHVREFLQVLSTRIGEGKRTPLVWKKP